MKIERVRIVKNPEMNERMVAMGVDPRGTSQAEFAAHLQEEGAPLGQGTQGSR